MTHCIRAGFSFLCLVNFGFRWLFFFFLGVAKEGNASFVFVALFVTLLDDLWMTLLDDLPRAGGEQGGRPHFSKPPSCKLWAKVG